MKRIRKELHNILYLSARRILGEQNELLHQFATLPLGSFLYAGCQIKWSVNSIKLTVLLYIMGKLA